MPGWLEQLWYGRSAWRWALWPLSLLFLSAVVLRRALYRSKVFKPRDTPLPVIVVGNLSVGGTGKTPLVIWLVGQLQHRKISVGVVSRGYGGRRLRSPHLLAAGDTAADVGDEPLLIARRTGVPVVVCADRAAAVRRLAAEGVCVAISDDGLQHYAMARVAEIVVIDGQRGLGNALCLPAGPLREPVLRLQGVDAVVVNGAADAHTGQDQTATPVPMAMQLQPGDLQSLSGMAAMPLAQLRGATVHAVAGIGHPQRFFRLLEQAGVQVLAHPVPDHARLDEAQLLFDDELPVVMTEKDAVRCTHLALPRHWYLPVEAELPAEEATALLARLLACIGTVATGMPAHG
jgi:tetraacyldisaccharide 4'-kinase